MQTSDGIFYHTLSKREENRHELALQTSRLLLFRMKHLRRENDGLMHQDLCVGCRQKYDSILI